MYSAKEEGHGYRFFTEEMNQKALERMRLENSLRCALHTKQFLVYYQPVADHNKSRDRHGSTVALESSGSGLD
jgi:predicted signal transduction protein with EAL and GGDEF domain